MNNKEFRKRLFMIGVTICIVVIFIMAISNKELVEKVISIIKGVSTPFLIGFTIAYILMPLLNLIKKILYRISKNRIKETTAEVISIALSEIIFLALVTAIGFIIIPEFLTSVKNIVEALPEMLSKTNDFLDKQINRNSLLQEVVGGSSKEMLNSTKEYIITNAKQNIENISTTILSSVTGVFSGIIDVIFGIFISIFTLASRKQIARQLTRMLFAYTTDKRANSIIEEVKSANVKFMGFFVGKLIDSLIIGLICLVVTLIMGIPYAGLVSFIVFLTNIVPIIGPFIGAIPSIILIFSVSPIQSLYFAIFIIILQQLDGNYIGPKCIGSSVKLNTFYVLFALLFFGEIWGMMGMIIGVPLFAVIYDLVKKSVDRRLEIKDKDTENIAEQETTD